MKPKLAVFATGAMTALALAIALVVFRRDETVEYCSVQKVSSSGAEVWHLGTPGSTEWPSQQIVLGVPMCIAKRGTRFLFVIYSTPDLLESIETGPEGNDRRGNHWAKFETAEGHRMLAITNGAVADYTQPNVRFEKLRLTSDFLCSKRPRRQFCEMIKPD